MLTLFGLRGERLQTAMSFAVVIPAFLAMGFSLSFLGGVVGYQPFYSQFSQIDTATTAGAIKKHNALIQGVTVATLNLGAILGCFSVMYLGNKLGRRKTTFVGAVVTLIGTVLQCSAFSIAQLIVARCMCIFFVKVKWDGELTSSGSRCRSRHDVFHCARVAVRNQQD